MSKKEANAIPSMAETAAALQTMHDEAKMRLYFTRATLESRISALDAGLVGLKDAICRAVLRGDGEDAAITAYNSAVTEKAAKQAFLDLLAERGCESILDGWLKQRQACVLMASEEVRFQPLDPARVAELLPRRTSLY